jgi:hypothetical protein
LQIPSGYPEIIQVDYEPATKKSRVTTRAKLHKYIIRPHICVRLPQPGFSGRMTLFQNFGAGRAALYTKKRLAFDRLAGRSAFEKRLGGKDDRKEIPNGS